MRRCPGAGSANTSSDEAAVGFFSVRCTVITDTRSTQPSSTTFSASRRRVGAEYGLPILQQDRRGMIPALPARVLTRRFLDDGLTALLVG